MVVKDKIGRRRYIIAKYDSKIEKIMPRIKEFDSYAKIIAIQKNFVIVRCRHWYKERILQYFNENDIKTIITTGTIRKAKKIIDSLNEN